MLIDVVYDRSRKQILDAHRSPQEQPDLGRTDVVRDQLLNDANVSFPMLQTFKSAIDVCPIADRGVSISIPES
jgi:hypothetical protein